MVTNKQELNSTLGSFKSFLHKRYIRNETTKELVETFIKKKEKYLKTIVENPTEFYEKANQAIKNKVSRQKL
jgi:ribosomal protein S20